MSAVNIHRFREVFLTDKEAQSRKARAALQGALVRLRALEPEDEPFVYRWFNDPDVIDTLGGHYTRSHWFERDWLEKNKQPSYEKASFMIVSLDDDSPIGTVGLRNVSPENRAADLGIAIGDKTRWNRGYGTDAMRVVCRFGFTSMNLRRIELELYATNTAALRVYEKVGFKIEARRRLSMLRHGRYEDTLLMGLLSGDLLL
jgi:RimJ/RimL family protein N-acetyltransferase